LDPVPTFQRASHEQPNEKKNGNEKTRNDKAVGGDKIRVGPPASRCTETELARWAVGARCC